MVDSSERKELRLDHRHLALFFLGAVAVCAVFFMLGFLVGQGQRSDLGRKTPAEPNLAAMKPAGTPLENPNTTADAQSAQALTPAASPQGAPSAGGVAGKEPAAAQNQNTKGGESKEAKQNLDFYSVVTDKTVQENFHPQSKAAEKPAAKPAEKASAKAGKPAAEKGAKSAAAPVAAASTAPAKKPLSLQVAALRNREDAEKLMSVLRAKGYDVFIVMPGAGSADQFIRVQVGPFTTEAEAAQIKTRLDKDGYKAITKR